MSKEPKRSAKRTGSYRKRKPEPLFQARSTSTTPAAIAPSQRVEYLVQLGIEAYQTRRLDDAVGYLTNALALAPKHALANNCLGIVRRSQGDLPAAISHYELAISTEPNYAEAFNNLGVACEAIGKLDRAVESYEAALRIKPQFAAARNNLGNALTKSGQPESALVHLKQALELNPGLAAAHNNMGLALSHLRRNREAEDSFRTAVRLQPVFPEAFLNLGNILRAAGKMEEAGDCYRQAIKQHANFVSAHVGLGNVLHDQHQPELALAEYELALRIQPRCAEAHFGIGNVLSSLDRDDEACTAWRDALKLKPDYAEANNNLGAMYHRQGHDVLAEKEFLAALHAKSELLAAHNNLGNLYREQDRMDLAVRSYSEVLRRQPAKPLSKLRLSTLCPAVWASRDAMRDYVVRAHAEWSELRGAHAYQDLPDLMAAANEPPYNLQFLDINVRPLKEAYANIFRYTGPTFRPRSTSPRIKLGFVVTSTHEVAFLRLIWSALKRLNGDEFERTILCSKSGSTLLRAAIRDQEAQVFEFPDRPHQILHAIREQHFDVLYFFEICTDALNYFLPFFRLAPVQVTSWGIQVTSGIPNVDAYLSSDLIEADNATEHYSEQLVRARTLLTYQNPIALPAAAKSRSAFGFRSDQHLYFCIQHLGKFHPDFDPIMAGILRQDPRGVIVATQDKHGYGAQRLQERFSKSMPDVQDRIVFLPRQPFQDYVSLAAASDVMLDPIHFGGVTTTYDSLSLNKPIVVWPSEFHRGRYTLGCYRRMGILDCVANSADEYVQIAVRLGTDAGWREQISTRIKESRHLIFEDQEAVSEHERIFRELVERNRQ